MTTTWTRSARTSPTTEQLVQRCLAISNILCAIALVFPALTAVGWIFDIPLLTRGHPALPAMQPNTAAGLALAALTILLTPEPSSTRRRANIPSLLALVVLLLGLLTLGEYVFGWNLGIDRLFVRAVPIAGQPVPGRPSPQTSVNFALVGAVLLSINRGRWPSLLGQIGAIAAGANAIAAATGYIFGTDALYLFSRVVPAIGMAVHTALTFVLLVAALFCRRPSDGMMTLVTSDTLSGLMARRILLAGIAAPPLVGGLTRLGVAAGWYDVSLERSLFVLVLGSLIVRTTWRAARHSEAEERLARDAHTALERANEQLKRALEERRLFAALVENSSDFIGIADVNGRPLYLNPGGRRMVGMTPDFPVSDTSIPEYYAPDQRTFASEVIVQSMIEHGHWAGETAFRHWQTEQPIPVSDTHFLIRHPATGQVLGMGTVTRDISELKRARDEITSFNQKLEALANASAQISEALAGLPEESVRTVFQTIALNAQHLTDAEFAAAGVGGDATHSFEVWASVGMSAEQSTAIGRIPRPVGMLGLVAAQDRTIRLEDLSRHPEFQGFPPHHPKMKSFLGVPIRYGGRAVGSLYLTNKRSGKEFTAQDQQLIEVLASRAGAAIETARLYAAEGRAHTWLQAVVEQMPEGIVLMDANGRLTMENQGIRVLTNACPAVLDRFGNAVSLDLRLPSGDRLAPDDFPIIKAIVDRQVTRGLEVVARRADNRTVPLLVSAAPIVGADGRTAGAAMVCQDISTFKELERTREEWASIVAHDLRQPITTILLKSTMLQRMALNDEQRQDVQHIRASADRLSRMVSDLTDAALLETHHLSVSLERLDLGELLHDAVQRAPLAASRTTIKTPHGDRVYINGDAQRLEQVVTNLLTNGVKYGAPETPIEVELTSAGGNAEFTVVNRGQGIPPDEIQLVFERYVRSRATAARRTKGLGLGLYICKGLVEAHGGRIWVESVPGDITTFHVSIPLDGPPLPADATTEAIGTATR